MNQLEKMHVVETEVTKTVSGSTSTGGWYTIAKRPADELVLQGIFNIKTDKNGLSNVECNLIYGNVFATHELVEDTPVNGGLYKARIIYHNTYKKSHASLEVYMDGGLTSVTINLLNGKGWELIEPVLNEKAVPESYICEEIILGETVQVEGAVEVANTALALATARTISLKGAVTGSVKFDGSADVVLNTTSETVGGYTHPETHPATMITEDDTHKFMTKAEKDKLAGIADQANKYEHPANHPASMITEDDEHKFVTDAEKKSIASKVDAAHVTAEIAKVIASAPETLNTLAKIATAINNNPSFATEILKSIEGKVDKVEGKVLSTNDYTAEDKAKLAGIAENANNYSHPANHPATIITEDDEHKFMTKAEKDKLAGIADQANKYEHPAEHLASMIKFADGETLQEKFDNGTLTDGGAGA